jgi:hypothetical protein
MFPEFPISAIEGNTPAAETRESKRTRVCALLDPRVPVETPTPPVLFAKHIGKETLAGKIPASFYFPDALSN